MELSIYDCLWTAKREGRRVRLRLRDGELCIGRVETVAVTFDRGAPTGEVEIDCSPSGSRRVAFQAIVAVVPGEAPVPVLPAFHALEN